MTGPWGPVEERRMADWRTFEALKVGVRRADPQLGAYSSSQLEVLRDVEHMMWELRTYVLAEQVGDATAVRTRRETAEFVGFATWWDHFKATYRGRWWMSWRRWQINYKISEQHLDGRVEVDLEQYWSYPQANVIPRDFGEPVRWIQQAGIRQDWASTEEKRFTREERA